jgi:hypothetical protein
MSSATGASYDRAAVDAWTAALEAGGRAPFAQALRGFIAGERSTLLNNALLPDESAVIMNLIRRAQLPDDRTP